VARDITGLGGHAILTMVALAALIYLVMTRKTHAALLLLAAVGGGMLLSTALKYGFERARPDLVRTGRGSTRRAFRAGTPCSRP
jgi:undecaprenyl-diphosphatase